MFFDTILNAFLNWSSREDDRSEAHNQYERSYDENVRQYNSSLNEMQRQYDTSLAFNQSQAQLQQANWEKNFAQQQYNFENATQIRANDMQKAGLNPLMLVGGAEGSTPVSLGASVSAPGASGAPGATSVSGRGAAPLDSQIKFGLLEKYLEMKEREKDRKNAKDIANINAQAQEYVADKSNEGVHYGADSSKSASKYTTDSASAIAKIVDKTRNEELKENKRQFNENFSQRVYEFEESYFQQKKLALLHEDNENARKLAEVTSANFRSALSAYESALRTSSEFALGLNRLQLDWKRYNTETDLKKRELALKNTQIALDSATRVFQSISGLAGDICKGFIIGRLK